MFHLARASQAAAAAGAVAGGLLFRSVAGALTTAAGAAVVVLAARIAFLLLCKKRLRPRGYKPFTPTRVTDRVEGMPCNRDIYKPRKVPENLDAIVIGSGMSGLYLAAVLARCGKRVLVLEQHYVAGGCMHVFEDKGFSFDTGLHYVGKASKYGKLIDMVSMGPKVEWVRLGNESNGWAYDEIHIPGCEPHVFRAGRARFEADLVERFPAYKDKIARYIDACLAANKAADPYVFGRLLSRPLRWLLHKFAAGKFFRHAGRSVAQVLDDLEITDPRLRAILCGQFGDYGLPPSEASFFIHAGVVCHYLAEGGYYPSGGPDKIALALIPTIEAAGGRVLVKARVQDIVVDPNSSEPRVCGVIMDDGTDIRIRPGGCVVSTIGCSGTSKLLASARRVHALPKRLEWEHAPDRIGTGVSHMYAFIGLRGSSEELGLRDSNIWSLPCSEDTYDLDALCRDYYSNPHENDDMLLFMGFPSAKDPRWREENPGKSTCCIITEAKEEWFQGYLEGASGKRGEDYDALKQKWKDRFLEGLFKYYPQCRGRVEYCELASPASNNYYLGRTDSYGMAPNVDRFLSDSMARFHPKDSVIAGLYHSGQDTLTAGVFGALLSGFVTAHAILGYDWVDLLVADRNLAEDLARLQKDNEAASKEE